MRSNLAKRIAHKKEQIKELNKTRNMYARQGRRVNADRCTHEITELVEDIIDLEAAMADIEESTDEIHSG